VILKAARTPRAASDGRSVTFHDIVVAVDGSADAELALTHAIDLAGHGRSRLTLFTAIAQPPPLAYWGLAAPGLLTFFELAEAEADKIARRARDRVSEHVCVTLVVTSRRVRAALVQQIADGQHDLVVMGGRDRSGISRYVLGHSAVPVLIVHGESFRHH